MPYEILRKHLDEVVQADLQVLLEDRVSERRRIEYKSALPDFDKHEEKVEFLGDVSSLANGSGGVILFGIFENEGVPVTIDGVDLGDPDASIRRVRQVLDDCVKPRMPGLEVAAIAVESDRYVLAVRVPRSWAAPHMVKVRASQRFYGRRDNGKMELDVHEIRAAFVGSEREVERIRDFRLGRLASIAARETPMPLEDGRPKLVLHLVPLTLGGVGSSEIDLHRIGPQSDQGFLPLLFTHSGYRSDWNFDGLVSADHRDVGGPCRSYTQVFRNGGIETVSIYPFGATIREDREVEYIACRMIEKEVVARTKSFTDLLRKAGTQPPLYAMLSLLGVRGRINTEFLSGNYWFSRDDFRTIARDDLQLPEVLLEDLDVAPERVLRPAFEVLWQATGFEGSKCWNGDVWDPKV